MNTSNPILQLQLSFSNVDYNIYSLNNPVYAMPIIQEFFNFFIFIFLQYLRQNFHFILIFNKNYRSKNYRELLRVFPQGTLSSLIG